MNRSLVTVIVLWTLSSCSKISNSKLDFGQVKFDSIPSCENYQTYAEELCGLNNICKSKNQLEVRFIVGYLPSPNYAIYTLAYNDSTWTAMKYEPNLSNRNFDKSHPIDSFKLKPKNSFENIFNAFKRNNIFALPDQVDLNVNTDYVEDGVRYSLTFKAGDKYRKYYFDNPDTYRKDFKQVKEFDSYYNIATIFDDSLFIQ